MKIHKLEAVKSVFSDTFLDIELDRSVYPRNIQTEEAAGILDFARC